MAAHFPPYTKLTQEPTGAYRAPPETDTVEDALRAACIALSNATDRLRAAQSAYLRDRGQPAPPTAKQSYDAQTARDVAWSAKRGDYTLPRWHPDYGKPRRDDLPPNLAAAIKTPLEPTRIATPAELAELRQLLSDEELKGFGIGDVPAESKTTLRELSAEAQKLGFYDNPHPMAAEALRQADEFERGDKETGV